jgi:predicted AlkP superfamily pyrophosphatase or phosphodiesterase
MRHLLVRLTTLSIVFCARLIWAAPVLMISVDGLRPLDIIEAAARGIRVPNLRKMISEGVYATGVTNLLPTNTYPNHTSLITGVAPALHGISNNIEFDPLEENDAGALWYASDIKIPTLWDIVHARGKIVASVSWPVSVGARQVDLLIPEIWRTNNSFDLRLVEALSSPGLIGELEKATGVKLAALIEKGSKSDEVRCEFTGALIELKKPYFITLHLPSLDRAEHEHGPGSQVAIATLEKVDEAIGALVKKARKIMPDLVVAVVSDHGFVPVTQVVNLMIPFIKHGLITLDSKTGTVSKWEAQPWSSGGSAAIVLARPNDEKLKEKVSRLLRDLALDPAMHISEVIDAKKIAEMGGPKEASFFVDFKLGTWAGKNKAGPVVGPSPAKGTHGYFPTHKEMNASFFITGPAIRKRGSIGEIDMRSIAPTLAKLMGLPFPDYGQPLIQL